MHTYVYQQDKPVTHKWNIDMRIVAVKVALEPFTAFRPCQCTGVHAKLLCRSMSHAFTGSLYVRTIARSRYTQDV